MSFDSKVKPCDWWVLRFWLRLERASADRKWDVQQNFQVEPCDWSVLRFGLKWKELLPSRNEMCNKTPKSRHVTGWWKEGTWPILERGSAGQKWDVQQKPPSPASPVIHCFTSRWQVVRAPRISWSIRRFFLCPRLHVAATDKCSGSTSTRATGKSPDAERQWEKWYALAMDWVWYWKFPLIKLQE